MLKVTDKKNGIVPEGYQLTSIGIIPLDWDLKPLGMIVDEITQTAGTEMYETVSISAGIGFVNQAKKFGKELSGNQYEKYIVLHKGDFSYNKGNSQKYPQGCIYRLIDRETAAVPNVFESFRIKDGVADYFEQLFIGGFLNRQLFAKINHGVRDNGLLNLTGEDFYRCKVPFPPIKEQKKIAEILIQYDKIIELCKCKLEKVIELKKACMDKMFPEQGKTIPEIRFPVFSDSWEQRKLGDMADIVGGGTPSTAIPEYWNGDIDWYTPAEIADQIYLWLSRKKITEQGYSNSSAKMLPEGTVLFTSRAGIGKTAILAQPGCTNQGFQSIVPHKGELDSYFIFSRTEEMKQYGETVGAGSTFVEVSGKQMANMEMMMPKLMEEQQAIGGFFHHLDNLIALYQCELDEMVKMKKALMQQLLTGRVRVKI